MLFPPLAGLCGKGGGTNEAGEVEDEDILILASDKEVSTSVTERVSEMLSSTHQPSLE